MDKRGNDMKCKSVLYVTFLLTMYGSICVSSSSNEHGVVSNANFDVNRYRMKFANPEEFDSLDSVQQQVIKNHLNEVSVLSQKAETDVTVLFGLLAAAKTRSRGQNIAFVISECPFFPNAAIDFLKMRARGKEKMKTSENVDG